MLGRACVVTALGMLLLAAPAGCFASIDRAKIQGDGAEDAGHVRDAADETTVSTPADGGGEIDGPSGPSPCSASHAFCADFDDLGKTPTSLGFEPIPTGELGTGTVTVASGGNASAGAARVQTPADPLAKPGRTVGLWRSLDPTRGFQLSFDVQIATADWSSYPAVTDIQMLAIATANDTVSLGLHVLNATQMDPTTAMAGRNRVKATFVDPEDQTQRSPDELFPFERWVHVDVVVAPAGVEVRVDGKVFFTRGAVSFDTAGRPGGDHFLLGVSRYDAAPAFDIRFDNVVLDYR